MVPPHTATAAGAAPALAVAGLGWLAFRRSRRGADVRRLVRTLVQRRVKKGRVAFARLFPGAYVHFVPEGADLEKALRPGEALAARDARGTPLVRFSLSDLFAADHPSADVFEPTTGLPEAFLPRDRVLFTVVPRVARETAEGVLDAAGLERDEAAPGPTEADPFGGAGVRLGPFTQPIGLADAVSEAVATVTPLSRVLEDRAHRARAELALYGAFHRAVVERFPLAWVAVEGPWLRLHLPGRPPHSLDYRRLAARLPGGRPGWEAWLDRFGQEWDGAEASESPWVARRLKPLSFVAAPEHARVIALDRGGHVEVFAAETGLDTEWLTPDHPLARGRSAATLERLADAALHRFAFGGHVILTGGDRSDEPRTVTVVGPGAASLAQHPDLLAGAARAAQAFAPGERVRVRAETEGVLVVARAGTPETFLGVCRRAAARLAEAMDVGTGGPLFLDVTGPLGERPTGHFAFSRVDRRFFTSARQERRARADGDMAGAAEARAMMRLALADPEGARVHLQEAVRLDPDDAGLHLALGTLLNDLSEHDEAEPILRRAVQLGPENPAASNNLGVAYLGLGRLDEAALAFEKAVALKGGDPLTRVNLGRVRLEQDDVPGAERAFGDALDLDPGCVPALTGRVMVSVRRGDPDAARERLSRALAADPSDEALLRLHRALYPDELLH